LIAGYVPGSKTDITVLLKGCGGLETCAKALPSGQAVFGGLRHRSNRFVTFWYCDDATPTMQKGRASLHKNGMSCCVFITIVCHEIYCKRLIFQFEPRLYSIFQVF
jgi:hypothetical protein